MINLLDSKTNLPYSVGFLALFFQFIDICLAQLLMVLIYWKHYEATRDQAIFNIFIFLQQNQPNLHFWFIEILGIIVIVGGIFKIFGMGNDEAKINLGWVITAIFLSLMLVSGYEISPIKDLSCWPAYTFFKFKHHHVEYWGSTFQNNRTNNWNVIDIVSALFIEELIISQAITNTE